MPRLTSLLAAAVLAATTTLTTAHAEEFAIAAPRVAGQFEYGTHVNAMDHAQMARAAGFKLMWGYVPWQAVEPRSWCGSGPHDPVMGP